MRFGEPNGLGAPLFILKLRALAGFDGTDGGIEVIREIADARSEAFSFQSPVDDEYAVILVNPNQYGTQVLGLRWELGPRPTQRDAG